MGIFVNILLIIFIPVCILLILMVLLQSGKGGGLSGAFGGMGANQPFLGARGTADFLSKLTVYLAIGFMALALILSIFYGPSRNIKVKDTTIDQSQTTDSGQPTTSTPAGGAKPTPKPSGTTTSPPKPATNPAGK